MAFVVVVVVQEKYFHIKASQITCLTIDSTWGKKNVKTGNLWKLVYKACVQYPRLSVSFCVSTFTYHCFVW